MRRILMFLAMLWAPFGTAFGQVQAPPPTVAPPAGPMDEALAAFRRGAVQEAARIWTELAGRGDIGAMVNLGELYIYGIGVDRNLQEGIRLFRAAAERGDATAQFNLGFMYEEGRGVPRSAAEARRYYELAAAQGHEGAQEALRGSGPAAPARPTPPRR